MNLDLTTEEYNLILEGLSAITKEKLASSLNTEMLTALLEGSRGGDAGAHMPGVKERYKVLEAECAAIKERVTVVQAKVIMLRDAAVVDGAFKRE